MQMLIFLLLDFWEIVFASVLNLTSKGTFSAVGSHSGAF